MCKARYSISRGYLIQISQNGVLLKSGYTMRSRVVVVAFVGLVVELQRGSKRKKAKKEEEGIEREREENNANKG